jgi:homogentisate 1,2-dioxygenase
MPFYQKRGRIPVKRHTVFPRTEGEGIHYEELMGNEGFTGASSLLYRLRRPTQLISAHVRKTVTWVAAEEGPLSPRHFRLGHLPGEGDPVLDRVPVLYNSDVAISLVRARKGDPIFFRNSQGDEVIYVAQGKGILETAFGDLKFGEGDYLVIPRGVVHRYLLEEGPAMLLVVESRGVVRIPQRYRNANGQFLEGAPFCERDIRTPENLKTVDETGEFEILTKMNHRITTHVVAAHPFDVVGWDGSYYPWAFQIRDFEAIVGRVHQPPPVHQTFAGDGFVVCSFVPRPYDFDSQAIPAPYNHTNAQSDEVIFYASEEFMSRKGVGFGSLTLHPDGLPHGPHPGRTEDSIGKTFTDELAVMVDTFRPLRVASAVVSVEDMEYLRSWLD